MSNICYHSSIFQTHSVTGSLWATLFKHGELETKATVQTGTLNRVHTENSVSILVPR